MLEYYKKSQALKALEARLPDEVGPVKLAVQELLADWPSDSGAKILLARCQQLDGELDEAANSLQSVVNDDPANMPAKAALAKVCFEKGDVTAAIATLTEATGTRPEVTENWQLLSEYLKHDGQEAAGEEAYKQYDMIKAFNDNLDQAEQAFARGEYVRADNMCRKLLQLIPNELRTLRLLASLAKHFRHYEVSTSILTQCVEVQPGNVLFGLDYAKSLLANQKPRETLEACDRLILLAPENIEIYSTKAQALFDLGRYQEAIEIYRELATVPDIRAACLLRLGKVLTTVGDTGEAIFSFQQAMREKPVPGQAWWELANLKTYRFSEDEVSAMQDFLNAENITLMDKVFVQFALGKALEDAGEFEKSFEHYQDANAGYGGILQYRYSRQTESFRAFFRPEFFVEKKPSGNESNAPIFILGLPRSGSTLLEQILTSHSQVDATMELPEITSMVRELNGSSMPGQGQYPGVLATLSEKQIGELAARYLDFVAPYRQGAPHFVDKLPGNFHHIGFIKTLFPNARIIDIRRNPMASGWSLYKHFFAESFGFSYDQNTIGKYYNDYVELMDHWHAVLPGQILTIQYEELISDFRGTVESLLAYCDLPFEEACIDFHLNPRAVATPSSEQVRQPVFADAVEQWKNYEAFLQPMKQIFRQSRVGGSG